MIKKLLLVLMSFAIVKTEISQLDITQIEKLIVPTVRAVCIDFSIIVNNISAKCNEQLNVLCSNTTLLDTMLDAWAKFPYPGLEYATKMDYGNFDQCLSINHLYAGGRILGEHCTAGLVIPDLSGDLTDIDSFYILGICRPNGCSASDYNAILNTVIDLPLFQDISCQTIESGTEVTTAGVVTITIFAVCTGLMVISSLYDFYLRKKQLKPSNPLYLAFSIVTNGEKLLQITKVTNSKEQIHIFHGLRTISIMWIIAGHGFTAWMYFTVSNASDVAEWQSKSYAVYITSSRIAVDTFFFISGFLLAYQYLKQKPKPVMAHVQSIPQMYIHRYLRLTPALLMTYLTMISMIIHLGKGPMWAIVLNRIVEPCREYWWTFFLYIQNYYNYTDDDLCIAPTWYLSADMQMFLLSPLVIIPITYFLSKPSGFKLSMWQMIILSLCFIALPLILKLAFPDYDNQYDTHSRLIDYFIGIILGTFMRVKQNKPFLYWINSENVSFTNLLFWTVTLAGMLAIVICHHEIENNYGHTSQSVFSALMRPAWCIGLSWIVYSCHHGYGGIVNSILCIPVFQILGKLTYCLYLLHMLVIICYAGTVRTRLYFNDYNAFYQFCGHYVVTVLVATFWTLAFESPLIVVEKAIFGRGNKSKKKENEPPKNLSIEEEQKAKEEEVAKHNGNYETVTVS